MQTPRQAKNVEPSADLHLLVLLQEKEGTKVECPLGCSESFVGPDGAGVHARVFQPQAT